MARKQQVMSWVLGLLLGAMPLWSLAETYQHDPVKQAAEEAERCNKIKKEESVIETRLRGQNYSFDEKRLKDRLEVVRGQKAKYCTAPVASATAPASKPAKK